MNNIKIFKSMDNHKYLNQIKNILNSLEDWFGCTEAIEEYIEGIKKSILWIACDVDKYVIGFFALKTHYNHTGEIFVCGICKEYQNLGVGKLIYKQVENHLKVNNFKYVMVKTLSDKVKDDFYYLTRKFYNSIGFEPLITLTEMWNQENPCLIMIKPI